MSRRYKHGMNWIRQEKRLALYMRDNFSCLYCNKGIESDEGMRLSLDHVKHFEGNHESNLVTACMDCNQAKSCWSLKSFLKKLPHPERVMKRVERALATPIAELLVEARAIRKKRNEPF
jgi:5-methylcytosine-specific restriction endonuclease McrA